MPTVADMLDAWRDRGRPPKPPRPRPPRPYKGVTFHRRHGRWVARYKFRQRTYSCGEFGSDLQAAYVRDSVAWRLTGGAIDPRHLNFPDLFRPMEAAS